MNVYILMNDPYHDLDRSNHVYGVYRTLVEAVKEMRAECDRREASNWGGDDMSLAEWCLDSNRDVRRWDCVNAGRRTFQARFTLTDAAGKPVEWSDLERQEGEASATSP